LIKDVGAPVMLVTSPRLGTLNHTFLSLESLKNRNIPIMSIIYNNYFKEEDRININNIETIKDFYPDIELLTLEDLPGVIFL
jgi:dethiobiotin synthetase